MDDLMMALTDANHFREAMYLLSLFLRDHGFFIVAITSNGAGYRLVRDDRKPVLDCTEITAGTFSQVFAKVLDMINKGELHE